jgi:mannose-6-phosphate isomerase-like protein (cupin superfamily)
MTTWTTRIACMLVAFASTAHAEPAARNKQAARPAAVFVTPEQLKWGDVPPDLPRGANLAVLHGDPTKPGQFTIRVKMPEGYKIAPHWHSQDEHLTVVSGTLVLHMGDTMTTEPHALTAGSYHFLPGRMHHAAEARGETVVQIHGAGPFDIHYLNPADNPNPKTATR